MTQGIPFELEGMVSTVTVLRLLTTDVAVIKRALLNKVEQMPGFFQDAPVALDVSALEGTDDEAEGDETPRREIDLVALASMLRELKLVPVGVRALREARRTEARVAGLGSIRGTGRKAVKPKAAQTAQTQTQAQAKPAERRSEPERPKPPAAAEGSAPALLLRTPLRSGQVVYAEQCDAVVLAPVNAGAELIADGNIHVYGALRGRALAGAHGNEEARIFCKSLEADLVAIAGCYLRADEIPEARRGKPAQIYLENDKLIVAEL
jgi:septum site-determining protein MinC